MFQAKRADNGDLVALKVIDKRRLKPELNHKVRNEIDIHKSLEYHSVVKVHIIVQQYMEIMYTSC